MRQIESQTGPVAESPAPGSVATVCVVCGKRFASKKPATACGGRCRAIRSREARRAEAVRRILLAEAALRGVRELLEHAPEGILAVPVFGGRS
jgi:hypothetical protein